MKIKLDSQQVRDSVQSQFVIGRRIDEQKKRAVSIKIGLLNFDLQTLIKQSAYYPDDLNVVLQQSENNKIYFDSIIYASKQFHNYNKVTDEELLYNYVQMTRSFVVENLQDEINKLDSQIEQDYQISSVMQPCFKKFSQYLSQVFNIPQQNQSIDQLKQYLTLFLKAQKEVLQQIYETLNVDYSANDNAQFEQSILSISFQNSTTTQKQKDKNMSFTYDQQFLLQMLRDDLDFLQLKVLKIIIILERINYYTMGGVVLPRDHEIKLVPFFGRDFDSADYSCQICLKICSLITHQIQRLEQIEIRIFQTSMKSKKTQQESQTLLNSYLFTRTPQEIKLKQDFKLKIDFTESLNRQRKIFEEFLCQSTKASLKDISLNLYLKVTQYADDSTHNTNLLHKIHLSDNNYKNSIQGKYKIQIQLYKSVGKTQCQQCTIQNVNDSWLFTEIKFSETLIKEDLIMVITVFAKRDTPRNILQSLIIQDSQIENQKQQMGFIKAFSIMNLSEIFFNNKMREGNLLEISDVKFYTFNRSFHNIHTDYENIFRNTKDLNQFLDGELTKKLKLKLEIAFITSIHRYQLDLHLDESIIMRQEQYWQKMILAQHVKLADDDPCAIYENEIVQLNIKELKRQPNELIVKIEQLKITKDSSSYNTCIIQVFFVSDDKDMKSSNKNFISHQNTKLLYHQTHYFTLQKGVANINSEFKLQLPQIKQYQQNLNKYKLIFVVLIPEDIFHKVAPHKIDFEQVTKNVDNYELNPVLFCNLPLIQNNTNVITQQTQIDLYKTSSAKIKETKTLVCSDPKQQIQGQISIQVQLISSQLSQNAELNKVINLQDGILIQNIIVNHLKKNDLLTHLQLIIYNLLVTYSSLDQNYNSSFDAFQSILHIFKTFKTQAFIPYNKILKDFAKIWSKSFSFDKNLLNKITNKFLNFCGDIKRIVDKPLTTEVQTDLIQNCEQTLLYLPELLDLMCRLFSVQFENESVQLKKQIKQLESQIYQLSDNSMFVTARDYQSINQIDKEDQNESVADINFQSCISNIQDQLSHLQKQNEQTEVNQGQDNLDIIQQRISNRMSMKISNNQQDIQQIEQFSGSNKNLRLVKNNTIIIKSNSSNQKEVIRTQIEDCNVLLQNLENSRKKFSDNIKNGINSLQKHLNQQINISPDDIKFHTIMNQIVMLQDQYQLSNQQVQLELDQQIDKLVANVYLKYQKVIKEFPYTLKIKFSNYSNGCLKLQNVFWMKLNQILHSVQQFIDLEFLNQLFDDQNLLQPVEYVAEQIVQQIIPNFQVVTAISGDFLKRILLFIQKNTENMDLSIKLKNDFESLQKKTLDFWDENVAEQNNQVNNLIKLKIIFLSQTLSSDVLFLNEKGQNNEILEEISLRICQSVLILSKQYKVKNKEKESGQKQNQKQDKDTISQELLYYFLYQIQEFEKKLIKVCQSPLKINYLKESYISQNPYESYRSDQGSFNEIRIASEESKEAIKNNINEENYTQSNLFDNLRSNQPIENDNQQNIRQVEIGKKKPVSYEVQQIKQQINKILKNFKKNNSEKRLCLFMNEIEEILMKYQDIKNNSENLKVEEFTLLRFQFNSFHSLFEVIAIQVLSNLTSNSLQILYGKRPGCLDRLLKQVYQVLRFQFGPNEFFFEVKRLQVVNQFCKDVINMICDQKYISDIKKLQVKYTQRSILSQIWNLQFTLYLKDAKMLYDYQSIVPSQNSDLFKKNVSQFQQRLAYHLQSQQTLWDNYKDMGDLLLSDEYIDSNSEIKTTLINLKLILAIIEVDLKNYNLKEIECAKLSFLLRPLAQMFVQIDILTYKTKGDLSQIIFEYIQTLFQEIFLTIISYNQKEKTQDANIVLKKKKKQVCNTFCDYYNDFIEQLQQNEQNGVFFNLIQQRFKEINYIKQLYLKILDYERIVTNQKVELQHGNLIAQLITFSDLMMKLQEKNLTYPYTLLIDYKYTIMINQIQNVIYESYLKQKENHKRQRPQDQNFQKNEFESYYKDQMKEVKAFMQFEKYQTFKKALDLGFIKSKSSATQKSFANMINAAVEALAPFDENSQDECPNQFFDVAIKLYQESNIWYNKTYQFQNAQIALQEQHKNYLRYKSFQSKKSYCGYYRLSMEDYLPDEIKVLGRNFIYRSPPNYNIEYFRDDLIALLEQNIVDPAKTIRKTHILTNDIRKQYEIMPNTPGLSNTSEEDYENCPKEYKTYYQQNFRNQFYIEYNPQLSQNQTVFQEEVCIVIYETKKTFPTITNIQVVERTYEKRIPGVKVVFHSCNIDIAVIQNLIQQHNELYIEQNTQNYIELRQDMEKLIHKFFINIGVGGGVQSYFDKYFNISLKDEFQQLDNQELKRAYLKLFQAFDSLLDELGKLLEVFYHYDSGLTAKGEEKLKQLKSSLKECKKAYKFQQLLDQY